jgi:hypothetical protein
MRKSYEPGKTYLLSTDKWQQKLTCQSSSTYEPEWVFLDGEGEFFGLIKFATPHIFEKFVKWGEVSSKELLTSSVEW